MKNVLKYPGSKTRVAPWIVEHIPEHKVYLEPFFGGGAVFFNKSPAYLETVNDISEEVYNYFQVLRDCPEELMLKIHLTTFSRAEYEHCYEYTEDRVERARRFAVRCCQGFGCSNRYKNGWRNSKSKMSPVTYKFWNEFPEILRQASERLKEAQIECKPAVELIKQYNKEEVFIYADPPYLLSTRKGYLYENEMTDEEHEELLMTLKEHKGKVMISGYDNKLYNELLKGWRISTCRAVAENSTMRTEKIWMNYSEDNFFNMKTEDAR